MPRLLAALILLTAAGCSGPLVRNAPDVEAPADFPGHTAEQIAYQLATQAPDIRAFRSEGRLHIESPTISQGIGVSIRASLADSLYAKLRGPLSLDVGRTLITADSILAHDKLNHKFYYGPLEVMDRYVPGAGEPGILAKTLLGMIAPTVTESTMVEADSQFYYVSVMDAAGHIREHWTVDPALWRVVRMEERATDGTVVTSRAFSSFDVVDDFVLPRHVELSSPAEGITITIEHRQLTMNPDPLTFPFSRPRDVELIPLE